jgi:hypothetical protein
MKRRLFVGGLVAIAVLTPLRRAFACAQLKQAYAIAVHDFLAWHANGNWCFWKDEVPLQQWRLSINSLHEIAQAAGLTPSEREIMHGMVIWSPPCGFNLTPIIAAHNPELAQKLGEQRRPRKEAYA